MQSNKIVVHLDGSSIKKGTTSDFFPNKPTFHLTLVNGTIEEIQIQKAKAVFFVKSLHGDNRYEYEYLDTVPGAGKKAAVEFEDGERIVGYVLGYSPQRQGFFLTPADKRGNNQRIYVVNTALKKLTFL